MLVAIKWSAGLCVLLLRGGVPLLFLGHAMPDTDLIIVYVAACMCVLAEHVVGYTLFCTVISKKRKCAKCSLAATVLVV
jgi:hypothetical protein